MNMTPPSPIRMIREVLAAPGAPPGRGEAVDVGAHAGAFATQLLASGLFDRVLAFEPNPANAAMLSALAAADSRLEVVCAALGDAPGEGELHCDADSATGSLLPYDARYATRGPVQLTRVAVTTLDAHRRRAGARGPVRLAKIDTQGHDLAVLRGARETIAADRPLIVVEMIHVPLYERQADPDEIAATLRAAGYEMHALFNIHATLEGRLAFTDALFVPREYGVKPSQRYLQLDNHASYLSQIATLERICRERLDVINVLDAEVKRLSAARAGGA